MGSQDSKCCELLEQMDWNLPELASDFYSPSLTSYLKSQNLEVTLPRHAPQCDISIGDRKGAMYPRPNFCWEGYKMHIALIGPSTQCKGQFTSFLPKIATVFRGPPSRLGPGREAIPWHFFDPELHRLVLWELPEINFKQHCEDYIRELGLLYIDCVFMLFSETYVLSEIYCKLCVAMAIHGVPFFVICTQSPDSDEMKVRRIKTDFAKKDIQVRVLNPSKPHAMVEELVTDFFKEVSWNRSQKDAERTKGLSEDILGQTVKLKNLEKKPELNGRCGVCVGYDSEQSRYIVRLINNGVETDIALKQTSFSILKPKLLGAMVRIHGLESKPELNGRFGFVDEFLRENERYRIFIPDRPNTALVLALKSANLEKVDNTSGARPIAAAPKAVTAPPRGATTTATPQRGGTPAGTAASAKASTSARAPATRDPPAKEKDNSAIFGSSPPSKDNSKIFGTPSPKPPEKPAATAGGGGSGGGGGMFSRMSSQQAARPGASTAAPAQSSPASWAGPPAPREEATKSPASASRDSAPALDPGLFRQREQAEGRREGVPHEDKDDDADDDLMARILAAEKEHEKPQRGKAEESAGASAAERSGPPPAEASSGYGAKKPAEEPAPPAAQEAEVPAAIPHLRLTRQGLLAFRVWVLVGDPDEAEDVVDNLMDCGKTVLCVSTVAEGASFRSVAAIEANLDLPKCEVLAFAGEDAGVEESVVEDALRLGLKGVVFHPSMDAFPAALAARCQAAGLLTCGADLLADIELGDGIAIAPLD